MRTWLRRTLVSVAIFIVCWSGAIWYWRSKNTMPATGDVALYVLVLPLVLMFLFWFAKKLILLVAVAPAAASADAPDAAAAAGAAPPPPPVAPVLNLLAGALRLPHGQSAQELREAVADNAARPDLDAELNDDAGFPVMTSRVASLDVEATQQAMTAWLEQSGLPDPDFSDEQWRALALGGEVAAELAQSATMHAHLHGYAEATPAARAALPMLQLLPMLPSSWELGQRLAAGRWLLHVVEQQGWPAERLALSAAAERGGASPLSLIGQLGLQSLREELPCVAILLACASHVGEDTIESWAAKGQLFTSKNQRGLIPGEGAAGLLLADDAQAALMMGDEAAPQLHGAVQAARGASADAAGRVDAALLTELAGEALRTADSEAALVKLLASDTDQRGSRVSEMMASAGAVLPELDAATQSVAVAASCGHAGPVAAVAALVLARQEVADNASHALYLSNQDPYQRSAALVRPRPEPKPPAA